MNRYKLRFGLRRRRRRCIFVFFFFSPALLPPLSTSCRFQNHSPRGGVNLSWICSSAHNAPDVNSNKRFYRESIKLQPRSDLKRTKMRLDEQIWWIAWVSINSRKFINLFRLGICQLGRSMPDDRSTASISKLRIDDFWSMRYGKLLF